MSKKLFLILGNGFTIDFLKHIGRFDDIDVINLFRRGTEVPWPATGMPGFLSFKHCPNLWNLGARPNMSARDAMDLIEDIITCVNVYASKKKPDEVGLGDRPNDIYIHAYKEFIQYIKHLFVFYNKQVPEIPDSAQSWPWLEFIRHASQSDSYSEIVVVTYNYDVWLERLLDRFKIPYKVGLVGDRVENARIKILKPHGSISFLHESKSARDSYGIKYDRELQDGSTEEFSVAYDGLDDNHLITALIPPAGDSERFRHTWSFPIRAEAKLKADRLDKDDEMIICGLSYWHVDRSELDELFTGCDPLLDVTMINPNPQRTINAVLTSIFSNFVTYSSSETLKEKMKCQSA
ncbi:MULTISPECIES: SIR2 family protein [unclassified Endozoicomonas]|uniref:SIR2 family protein n=1 Tax=unclassified Endozoicomonas TaxID=2644528 RepID=UPI002148AA4B|nr:MULTISPECIES: SIR2 family protein [unclassified Endozoicomonas]